MLHRKLLLRRLAYVPWLLVVGLVLGWSGEVLAHSASNAKHHYDYGNGSDHLHATDPKMVLTYELDKDQDDADEFHSITVRWSTSQSRNFTTDSDNGLPAETYTVELYSGKIPSDIVNGAGTRIGSEGTVDATAETFETEHIFTHANIASPGEYWVRMQVEVNATADNDTYFAKQIVLEPNFELSVHPTSVREDDDARPTEITVRVRVGSDDQVDDENDRNVLIDLAPYAKRFSDRFSIDYPNTLTIPKGEKEAVGQITFTPTENTDDEEGDLPITMEGFVTDRSVSSADITLTDDDKPSRFINLSFSPDEVSQSGPEIDIEVTASLDGKELDEDLRFTLNIDDGYEDEDDAAERETDYRAFLNSITIREGKVSGRTTISIRPLNEGDGLIGIIVKRPLQLEGGDERTININRAFIRLTDEPAKEVIGLKATPFAIREDAGVKEVTLEVSLAEPRVEKREGTVQF